MMEGISGPSGDSEVLSALGTHGPLARTELARVTGRSAATVSRAVDRLRRAGVVRERPATGSGRGRPPRVIEIRPDAACVVGVDAGGSMLRAVRADLEGVVRARAARPARDTTDAAALVADLLALVDDVRDAAGGPALLAVVAGISGIVDHAAGRVLVSPDLPGLDDVALAEVLQDRLGVPAAIDNDDLLAAIGEASDGAARGCRDVAFLSFGYGLGAGLIVDGRPVRGRSSAAGAMAYLDGGRLEARASGRSMPVRYAEACAAAGRDPEPLARVDARGVFELSAAGDPIAGAVVDDAVDAIAEAALDVAALLDPEVIVLGGGLTANGGRVLETVAGRLAEVLPYAPRVAVSALEGTAVLQGAVSLALAEARRGLPIRHRPVRAQSPRPATLELT
jgi:predicted NBD/HSP70 family sugar kinase